jgi:hypothetical protein
MHQLELATSDRPVPRRVRPAEVDRLALGHDAVVRARPSVEKSEVQSGEQLPERRVVDRAAGCATLRHRRRVTHVA